MTLSVEFYDYLHELEKGGSINRFDIAQSLLSFMSWLLERLKIDELIVLSFLSEDLISGKSLLKQSLQRQLLKFFVEKQEFRLYLTITI